MTYAVVSGGFDPLHEGHVAYIQAAAQLGEVIVILNSDKWLTCKKGKPFMGWKSRAQVLRAMQGVKFVVEAADTGGTVEATLDALLTAYGNEKLIFCKGGDRSDAANVPELDWCRANNVPVVLGCGGYSKANSSSELIKRAQG